MTISEEEKIDVQVIDDKLISEGLMVANIGITSKQYGETNLLDVAPSALRLSISFKNIGRIENLVGFDRLEKLCLDNNLLEEILNLGHLKQLKWLDLSFNKIRKIQGLENLEKLEDLSLYCNKISVIEGLESCQNLQCLSLGNNRIDSLDDVIRLRQIRSLKMLTLSNNPIEKDTEYRMTVLAYTDNLQYLDYAMIDKNERLAAKERYQDDLLDLKERESAMDEQLGRDQATLEYVTKLRSASILFAHTIFDDIFLNDHEYNNLKCLPGVSNHVDEFSVGFKKMSEEYIRISLERFEKNQKDIADFDRAVKNMRSKDDAMSTSLVEKFEKAKRLIVRELTSSSASSSSSSGSSRADGQRMVRQLQEELEKLCDELMSIELSLNEKFDVLMDGFENHTVDAKNVLLEAQQLFFREVEDLEGRFFKNMRTLCFDLIERYMRGESEEEALTEEAVSLVNDKDICLGLVSTSHDHHVGKILTKEDAARGAATARTAALLSSYTTGERARNRDRILQIRDLHSSCKDSFSSLLDSEDDEGFDEEEGVGK